MSGNFVMIRGYDRTFNQFICVNQSKIYQVATLNGLGPRLNVHSATIIHLHHHSLFVMKILIVNHFPIVNGHCFFEVYLLAKANQTRRGHTRVKCSFSEAPDGFLK